MLLSPRRLLAHLQLPNPHRQVPHRPLSVHCRQRVMWTKRPPGLPQKNQPTPAASTSLPLGLHCEPRFILLLISRTKNLFPEMSTATLQEMSTATPRC